MHCPRQARTTGHIPSQSKSCPPRIPCLGKFIGVSRMCFYRTVLPGSGSSGVPIKIGLPPSCRALSGWVLHDGLWASPLCFGSMVPFLVYYL